MDSSSAHDGVTVVQVFAEDARRNNPWRMLDAYHQSSQTLNILRAFATGGYADISRLHAWNLDFTVGQASPPVPGNGF